MPYPRIEKYRAFPIWLELNLCISLILSLFMYRYFLNATSTHTTLPRTYNTRSLMVFWNTFFHTSLSMFFYFFNKVYKKSLPGNLKNTNLVLPLVRVLVSMYYCCRKYEWVSTEFSSEHICHVVHLCPTPSNHIKNWKFPLKRFSFEATSSNGKC